MQAEATVTTQQAARERLTTERAELEAAVDHRS